MKLSWRTAVALWFAVSGLLGTILDSPGSTGPVLLASSHQGVTSTATDGPLALFTPSPSPVPPEPEPTPTASPAPPPTPSPTPAPQSVADRIRAEWKRQGLSNDQWAVDTTWCESRHNPRAVSRSGKYRGLWQADASFWRSYGGHQYASDPIDATVEEQTHVASNGYKARGSSPWPTCG